MSSFHVHQERSTQPISLMKWSPKMDLIALVLETDEIALHRLEGWQRVWNISLGVKATVSSSSRKSKSPAKPPKFIAGIEWRLDGRVLAVAYQRNILCTLDVSAVQNDSSVALIEVESSEVMYVIELPNFTVTCLSWSSESPFPTSTPSPVDSDTSSPLSQTEMRLNEFLGPMIRDTVNLPIPPLRALSKAESQQYGPIPLRKMTDENLSDLLKVESLKQLNVLAVGSSQGDVQLFALGLLKIAHVKESMPVIAIDLSESLTHLTIATQEKNSSQCVVSYYPLTNIHQHCPQYLAVTLIYSRILNLLRYTKECMLSILEIWEEIVIEVETKLSIYFKMSENDPEPSAPSADEFFELLALGTASPSLENFLKEIGEKGLRRLNSSIELTYSNIQRTVVACLERVSHHLVHLLCHLNGMASWETEFSQLGLIREKISSGIHSAGQFLMKSVEFQQVIDTSIRNVKAFFRWLHNTMVRLHGSDSNTMSEVNKISQQELMLVAEFIEEHFETYEKLHAGESHHRIENIFTLDRVGQYLKDEQLSTLLRVTNSSENPWVLFVNDKWLTSQSGESWLDLIDSRDSASIFRCNPSMSLYQQHVELISVVNSSFTSLDLDITSDLSEKLTLGPADVAFDHASPSYFCSHIANTSSQLLFSAFSPKAYVQSTLEGKGQVETPVYPECVVLLKHPVNCSPSTAVETQVLRVAFKETNAPDAPILQVLSHEFYHQDSLFILLVTPCRTFYFLALIPVACMECSEGEEEDDADSPSQSSTRTHVIALDSSMSEVNAQICYRKLEAGGSEWTKLAVSGSRRLAVVAANRKVKIFETDASAVYDEEEVDEDTGEVMRDSPTAHDTSGGSANMSQ